MTFNSGETQNGVTMPIEVIIGAGSAALGQGGEVISRTLVIKDATNKLFTLHMEAQRNEDSDSAFTDVGYELDAPEPVFSVPCDSLDESMAKRVLDGISPDLLDLYLVRQDDW